MSSAFSFSFSNKEKGQTNVETPFYKGVLLKLSML